MTWSKGKGPIIIMGFALIIGLPALFMTIDDACSPVSNAFCRQWLDFQWETVVAGILGLGGGYLALAAVKWQDSNQRRRAIETCRKDLAELRTLINVSIDKRKTLLYELGEVFALCRAMNSGEKLSPTGYNHIGLAQQNKPQEIVGFVDDLVTIEDTVKQITFDFRSVISLIHRIGLNRHVRAIPMDGFLAMASNVAKFENIYVNERGEMRSESDKLAISVTQVKEMYFAMHSNHFNSARPITWHIDKMIRDLDTQIANLPRFG